jgi:Mn-dependent DtxR family transcriptional regulator
MTDYKLTPANKLLLGVIKKKSDKNKICKATTDELAKLMEVSPIYIAKMLKKLKDVGKIDIRRVGSTGREITLL